MKTADGIELPTVEFATLYDENGARFQTKVRHWNGAWRLNGPKNYGELVQNYYAKASNAIRARQKDLQRQIDELTRFKASLDFDIKAAEARENE